MNLCKSMSNKEFNTIICKRIKDLRKAKNLKMEQLAYQSGISKGGLSEIERNMKEPKIYTILKICASLNIKLKDFFNFEEIDKFEDNL